MKDDPLELAGSAFYVPLQFARTVDAAVDIERGGDAVDGDGVGPGQEHPFEVVDLFAGGHRLLQLGRSFQQNKYMTRKKPETGESG